MPDYVKALANAFPHDDAKRVNLILDGFAVVVFIAILMYATKENYPELQDEFRFVLILMSFAFMIVMTIYCLLTHAKIPTGSNS